MTTACQPEKQPKEKIKRDGGKDLTEFSEVMKEVTRYKPRSEFKVPAARVWCDIECLEETG